MNLLALYIGLSVLLVVLLAINISRLRVINKVAFGDDGNLEIKKAIRAHMNTLENTLPYALILFVLYNQAVSQLTFAYMAFLFFFVRVLYAYSVLFSVYKLRQASAGISYIFIVTGCIMVIFNA